jgi:predicted metal-binding protein
MKATCIGIWMDHASANLMELTSGEMVTTTIASTFTNEVKKETLQKGQKATHHKEQHQTLAYFKEIAAVLKNYKEILLFGPTDAAAEFKNILKADHHFDHINIEVKHSDKMTENQQHAFVKKYFFKHLSTIV